MANVIEDTENLTVTIVVLLVLGAIALVLWKFRGFFSGDNGSAAQYLQGVQESIRNAEDFVSGPTIQDPQTYAADLGIIDPGIAPIQLYQFDPDSAAAAYSLWTSEGMDLNSLLPAPDVNYDNTLPDGGTIFSKLQKAGVF